MMTWSIYLIFQGCVFLTPLSISNPTFGEVEEAERRAVFQSLSAEDQAYLQSLSESRRNEYLTTMAFSRRMDSYQPEGQPKRAPETTSKTIQPYDLDFKLKKAFQNYLDDSVPREIVLRDFQSYLESNPQSPFLAEIYFRMGALYGIHRRQNLGESKAPEMTDLYYRKAHELYGDRFCYLHQIAWATLANRSPSLSDKKAYYQWLLKCRQCDPSDLFPFREIEQTFNGGSVEIPETDKMQMLAMVHRNIRQASIPVAEQNIWVSAANNLEWLVDLAQSFPDTDLGKKARRRIHDLAPNSSEALPILSDAIEPAMIAEPSPHEDSGPEVYRPSSFSWLLSQTESSWRMPALLCGFFVPISLWLYYRIKRRG